MADNSKLFDMASLAEAAYATFTDAVGALTIVTKGDLIDRLQDFNADRLKDGKSFSETQAKEFANHYRVVSQQPNTESGYSATLFERLDDSGAGTGEYVFAQRGTEAFTQWSPATPLGLDLAVDVGDLVADGLAWSQIVDMYNYWNQLTTPEGQTYQKATLIAAPLDAVAGTYISDYSPGNVPRNWQIQLTAASSPSGFKIPAGAALEVTGHSLGGHLASAFTRLFAGVASQAYSINGAGYAQIPGSTNIQYVFSQLGGAGSFTSAVVQNLRGSAGPDIVTQNSVLVQVGASDQIFIEQGGLFTDNPILSYDAVFGHSAAQMTDAAAVYDLFIQLDGDAATRGPTQYLPKLLGVFEAGANAKATSFEAVVCALARTFGVDGSPIATDSREALHARIKLIRDDPDFQSMAGQILVRSETFDCRAAARNDFGALVALIDLSPFSITGKDAAADALLNTVWQTTRADDYGAWQVDQSESSPVNFTDQWLVDRAVLLQAIVTRNKQDNSTGLIYDVAATKDCALAFQFYEAENTQQETLFFQRQGGGVSKEQRIVFGDDGNNTITGSDTNQLGDHLYGGGGNDIISGLAGNDYLEGNIGADTLKGGDGNDTLLSGAGNDSLEGEAGNDQLKGGAGTDTYHFGVGWGSDLIQDSDGEGSIQIDVLGSISGAGATKVADNVWQTADKSVNYTLVAIDASQSDLFITFSDRPDVIRIRGWSADKSLGITLDGAITSPPANPALAGDIAKQNNGNTYTVSDSNYVSAGPELDALDVLNGTDEAETLQGEGGNDGLYGADGADQLDGGDGADLLLGGPGADVLNGGEGNDVIFGSAVGSIDTPTDMDFPMPDTSAYDVVATGFSWAALRAPLSPQDVGNLLLFRPINVTGAITSPAWTYGGETYVEREGNVIDGGAGDDYIAAGTGDDLVQGGDGDDDIIGMDHDDLLAGNAGDDYIFGDGTQRPDPAIFTPLDSHGNDTILGGAGRDVLIGQGGDDELYGGDGNDLMWTDETDLQETPALYHGNDYADGGDGDDYIVGGGKDDTLFGGIDNDRLWGDGSWAGQVPLDAQGQDYLDGEDGDDYLEGGGNNDELFGGAGDDLMFGDGQAELPISAHGDDYMDGEAGNDLMAGGGGDDIMYGGEGDDQLQGDDLNSNVDVSAHGEDYLDGGSGNDSLVGGGQGDSLSGGDGNDFLRGDDKLENVAASAHGNDFLDGGAGRDWLVGDGGNDTLIGSAGNDILRGDDQDDDNGLPGNFHGNDYLDGGDGDDQMGGDGGSDTLVGGAGNDLLHGDAPSLASGWHGDDLLDGGEGNDSIAGESGNDTLVGAAGDDLAAGGDGDDLLDGGEGNDTLAGESGNDTLLGGAGDDLLGSGDGDDVLDGGYGNDRFGILGTAGNKTIFDNGGVDTLALGWHYGDIQLTRGSLIFTNTSTGQQVHVMDFGAGDAGIEYVELAGYDGAAPDVWRMEALVNNLQVQVRGTDGDDFLEGTPYADRIEGGAGADTLVGLQGDDTYVLGVDTSDTIIEQQDEGWDTVSVASSYTLEGTNLEAIELTGSDDLSATGNAFDNVLYGNSGNNVLDGGAGRDELMGFAGDDVYYVDDLDEYVYEQADEGADTVYASVNFMLGSNTESLYLSGGAFYGGGNDQDNLIEGTDGDNRLEGWSGSDMLIGHDGDDVLTGGEGVDTLVGGLGDDVYFGKHEDLILEAEDAGTDCLVADTSVDLSETGLENIENVTLVNLGDYSDVFNPLDWDAWDATGNGLDNVIVGNLEANILLGLGASDVLRGLEGADVLDGGEGVDTLLGGEGDDTYIVDNVGDAAIEVIRNYRGEVLEAGGGYDRVYATASIVLGEAIEGATLLGSDDIDATGNEQDNIITGNDGNNRLDGGAGADLLLGGGGNDSYRIDAQDVAVEEPGAGIDTVYVGQDWVLGGNLENLVLVNQAGGATAGTGNELGNIITGNDLGNTLRGLDGDDTLVGGALVDLLDGGAGSDSMSGGFGDDIYIVDGAQDRVGEAVFEGRDTVVASADYTIGANVEDLVLVGDASAGVGNALDNWLVGNTSGSTLRGMDGADTLNGMEGNDLLEGGDGNDSLDGGAGADVMRGGGGDDIYCVDDEGDVTEDVEDGGYDGVDATASHTLGAGIEFLRMNGKGTNGTGNELDNEIIGAGWSDVLAGAAGNDTIVGDWGNDLLVGGDGNDWLAGESDRDTLEGGAGDDTYELGQSADEDTVVEGGDAGRDLVWARASRALGGYTLGDNLEDLRLGEQGQFYDPYEGDSGLGGLWGVGNELDNGMRGSRNPNYLGGMDGNDSIDGWSGDDTIDGGAGDDMLYGGDDSAMVILRGESDDRSELPLRSREPLNGETGQYNDEFLLEDSNSDFIDGGDGDDRIDGGSGSDALYGGAGADTLLGGASGVQLYNDDLLDGGTGIDLLEGGTGDDTYIVDGEATADPQGRPVVLALCDAEHRFGMDVAPVYAWVSDTVAEQAGEGYDIVITSASVDLSNSEIEGVDLSGDGPILDIDATTGWDAQWLRGNSGNNRLDGGAGADYMEGSIGDDTYIVDDVADEVQEYTDGGFDMVRTALDAYVLGDHVEGLVLEGADDISGQGNGADNLLVGNTGDNTLGGGDGNDTLAGWRGDDLLLGGAGADIYVVARGDGRDVIDDLQGDGTLHFSGGIGASDVSVHKDGNDLVIFVAAGAGTFDGAEVRLLNWVGAAERVTLLSFCEGPSLVLAEPNGPPVAEADHASLLEDGPPATGNVLTNDSDPDAGDGLTVTTAGAQAGAYGSLVLAADGSYVYALDNASVRVQSLANGQTVTESFAYTAADNEGSTATATLEVSIGGANDAPVAVADSAAVSEDGVLYASGNMLANDGDVDTGDTISLASVASFIGHYGSLTLVQDGSYNYALNNASATVQALAAGQEVQDIFSYTVADALGATATAQLTVTIAGADEAVCGDDEDDDQDHDGNDDGGSDDHDDSDGHDGDGSHDGDDEHDREHQDEPAHEDDRQDSGRKVLTGGAGDDALTGDPGGDVLDGRAGNDDLRGGRGDDTYIMTRGNGRDSINEDDATPGNADRAVFGPDITCDQLWFQHKGADLQVGVIGTSDRFTIVNWYSGSQHHVEQFKTSDGKTLLDSQVQNLVDAMASFSPPPPGQTTLLPDYQSALGGVIAANWQ